MFQLHTSKQQKLNFHGFRGFLMNRESFPTNRRRAVDITMAAKS